MTPFGPVIRGDRNVYGGLVETAVGNEVATLNLKHCVLQFNAQVGLDGEAALTALP